MLNELTMESFVAGPEVDDEHDFCCMSCKHDVSVHSEGAGELLWHFASKSRFARGHCFQITDDGVLYI